ncbi:hypothetical protein OsJ_05265 [Oryza sativa Japonica Group]|uniref:Uncharacterized protein n=1 Tax=Oryza sativa subsp. japonica TaxID=39947 RepID=A3A2U7_ORYSJ|nr:hypothetical protein OsJ_05265 [Oryza sativa Japonica Group]
MAVFLLKSKAIPTSVIAFAGDVPLLAGGVVQDNGISPRTPMSIFRTSPGEKMLEMAGLIAGGLENGMVAMWNPDLKLRKLPSYLPDEEILKPHPDGVQTWIRKDFEVIEDYLDQVQVDGNSRALHLQVSPTYQEMSGNLMVEYQDDIMCRTSSSGVVALFAKHTGKVRGLSFNPNAPNLLASGAADGRIMLYDLAHPLAETIPVQATAVSPAALLRLKQAASSKRTNLPSTLPDAQDVAAVEDENPSGGFTKEILSILNGPDDAEELRGAQAPPEESEDAEESVVNRILDTEWFAAPPPSNPLAAWRKEVAREKKKRWMELM